MEHMKKNIYKEGDTHSIHDLENIITILRSPEGCEWDRTRTHDTLKKCLLDETEEVLEAIEHQDDENLCEELGDLLLQVLMHAEIAKERGAFDFQDVVQGISDKMIRRHPHVFGNAARPKNREEALELWNRIKKEEKA